MKRYNHGFDMAFSVVTESENPEDTSEKEIYKAILERVVNLLNGDALKEAIVYCDTYEED